MAKKTKSVARKSKTAKKAAKKSPAKKQKKGVARSRLMVNAITIMYPANNATNIPVNFTANGTTDPGLGEVEVGGIIADVGASAVYFGTPATQLTTGSASPPDWFISFPDTGSLPANTDLVLTAYLTNATGDDSVNFRTGAAAFAPITVSSAAALPSSADDITLSASVSGNDVTVGGTVPGLKKARVAIFVIARTNAKANTRTKVVRCKPDRSFSHTFRSLVAGQYLVVAKVVGGRKAATRQITIP